MRMALFILGAWFAAAAFAADPKPEEYNAQKWAKESAESMCTLLAGVTLHPSDYKALVVHTESEVRAFVHDDGYMIAVYYPYRVDGVAFACVFRDYRDGTLQLQEFGAIKKGSEGSPGITNVELLW